MVSERLSRIAACLHDVVRSTRRLSGGDTSEAYRVDLQRRGTVFIKIPTAGGRSPAGLYLAEAAGLDWLRRAASSLRIPRVVYVGSEGLVQEYVETVAEGPDSAERLGRGLAELHRAGAPEWGWSRANFVGPLHQDNEPADSWLGFWRDRRLRPRLDQARQHGMPEGLVGRLERLCNRLGDYLGDPEPPARLHGDLWRGNVLVTRPDVPVLIDPAVYGGHREVDLAMMQLFGGFSDRVFAAYDEAYPLAANWRDRVPFYQLYPLLVHVVLFGASYLAPLDAALHRLRA
ncbi:MAG: fructosamine kinase [Myxococcales bacterium FL481]|nr:MAG: fructosamine kinase [Myxococcales bacterium FL481]